MHSVMTAQTLNSVLTCFCTFIVCLEVLDQEWMHDSSWNDVICKTPLCVCTCRCAHCTHLCF